MIEDINTRLRSLEISKICRMHPPVNEVYNKHDILDLEGNNKKLEETNLHKNDAVCSYYPEEPLQYTPMMQKLC